MIMGCRGHLDDAGVRCAQSKLKHVQLITLYFSLLVLPLACYSICLYVCVDCSNGDLRLTDGMTSREGRVEICLNGEWGTVCQTQFSNADAQVTCNQLGFSPFGMCFPH